MRATCKEYSFILIPILDISLTFPKSPDLFKKLVRMNGISRSDSPDIPLLSVQLTWFESGTFSLGLAYNHLFMDGHSFWYFLNSWSQSARGESLTVIPILKRTLLLDAGCVHPPSLAGYRCLYSSGAINISKLPQPLHDQSFQNRWYKFSGRRIQKLKLLAMESYPERPPFSSFEVVCAHVWRSVTVARALNDGEQTSFLFAVDCRRRIDPALPESYFGNASCAACATTTAGELTRKCLSYAANMIHEASRAITNESTRTFLHWCKQQESSHLQMPRMNKGYDLFCGSSHRFPVYETDFGWGPPMTVRTPALPSDGVMLLFPCSDDAKGIEVCLHLSLDTYSRLETDFPLL
ncbi:hypothetical protein O6H91_18G023500 [Diphasiastrum complanatum]|uniref:Uncharacterized protein n=1 Tax=Diphasiastrum complanatum TaxID=34168 RepID=A0ACC2AYZ7_DIPCM|nr:hypothetical protein O6H91_18G023500 [Diphasiastrum complanatum]